LKSKLIVAFLFVAFVVSLAANIYFTQQSRPALDVNLQNQLSDLQKQAANLQSEVASLQNQTVQLQSDNLMLQSENADLKKQLSLATPASSNWYSWLETKLGAKDINSSPYSKAYPELKVVTRFYIQGEVTNVGNGTAYDAKLHIKLYQAQVLTYEVYFTLGNLESGSTVNVDENIVYTGEALSSWEILPEYALNS
jgi:hypothetical protein